ncbi:MAG: glycyl-radical enzyme activating protein [Clostridia bacterium]|nr:glycyl-radical enzyme activating protein [Clostridia bacterium]
MIGRLFDVKEFAVHDGPGARMTFFLKGCPLRCLWCHNPEGQRFDKELMVRSALCEHCGLCSRPAENELFRSYGRNPASCPKGLISECGEDLTPSELVDRVLPLKEILTSMGGGVTLSGGEPLMQGDFLLECCALLRDHGIHLALETCGYASEEVFREAVGAVDYVMMDLKIMDPEAHKSATGVSNEIILKNARYLMESGREFVFRTPLIPRYTDSPENLEAIASFVGEAPWETLPYNELAGAKYSMLNRIYPLDEKKENEI